MGYLVNNGVHTFILSLSIHTLIFSVPVSMLIKPQVHDMELFVSIEDIRVPPESVKMETETKKPQHEPVKQISAAIEVPRLKIKKSEAAKPIREVRAESAKEIKVEPIELESDSEPTAENKGDLCIPNLVQD